MNDQKHTEVVESATQKLHSIGEYVKKNTATRKERESVINDLQEFLVELKESTGTNSWKVYTLVQTLNKLKKQAVTRQELKQLGMTISRSDLRKFVKAGYFEQVDLDDHGTIVCGYQTKGLDFEVSTTEEAESLG